MGGLPSYDPLWDVVPGSQRVASQAAPAGAGSRLSSYTCSMGYLEYYSWLQQAVPESLPESPENALLEGQDEFLHLSGLQLLRKLNEAARPKIRRRVPELTAEEIALANDGLWGDGSSSEVLASRFSVDLTRGQLQCLRPGEWLNDEVINFYY